MKAFIIIALTIFIAQTALAREPHLLLVQTQTSVRPHTVSSKRSTERHPNLTFDVYLYNGSGRPVSAPTLEFFSTVAWVSNSMDRRSGFLGGEDEMSNGGLLDHLLPANSVEHRRIKVELPAQPGDLLEVHIEIGHFRNRIRSNTVLLFCPTTPR